MDTVIWKVEQAEASKIIQAWLVCYDAIVDAIVAKFEGRHDG